MADSAEQHFDGRARNVVQVNNLHGDVVLPGTGSSAAGAVLNARPQQGPVLLNGSIDDIRGSGNVLLWGAPGSGKTCFLAALDVAVAHSERWKVVGADRESAEYLLQSTAHLIRDRSFPPLSVITHKVSLRLMSELDAIDATGRRRTVPVSLDLSVADVPGGLFRAPRGEVDNSHGGELDLVGQFDWHRPVDDLSESLAGCDSLIYFFDFDREAGVGDSIDYFQYAAAELEKRFGGHGRVPHRVAVCVAKYDRPDVLDVARSGGHIEMGAVQGRTFPVVPESRARLLFDDLCDASPTGSAALVRHSLRRYFRPERVRYFATSAIGFFHDPMVRFRWDNCHNFDQSPLGMRLRGDITPVNVLEPLLWLHQG